MYSHGVTRTCRVLTQVCTHRLNVYTSSKPVHQKKSVFAPKLDIAIKEEVQKLTITKFIREVYCPDWLAN